MTALENVLVGDAFAPQGELGRRAVLDAEGPQGGEVTPGSAPGSCSSSSASRARTTSSPRTCRTATSAGWRSPGRSASEPVLLLLDEPTAGMNPNETAELTDAHRPPAPGPRPDDPAHRARHARGDGHQRPGDGARPRREDRRGHAGGGPRNPRSSRPTSGLRPNDRNGDRPARATPNGESMLVLDDVNTYYGNIHALQGISLTVDRGEIVTLIGQTARARRRPSRRSAACSTRARHGDFEGKDVSKTAAHNLVRQGMGMRRKAAGSSGG